MFEKMINMKEKHTLPNAPNEHKITLLLGLRGIKSKDLDWAYFNSPGQEERGDTAWRWFSSITYWADNMISDRELESGSNILNGTRARQKAKAFEIAKNYIVG